MTGVQTCALPISGCPKVRCMEILSEMEKESRGAYTGSVGYINRDEIGRASCRERV